MLRLPRATAAGGLLPARRGAAARIPQLGPRRWSSGIAPRRGATTSPPPARETAVRPTAGAGTANRRRVSQFPRVRRVGTSRLRHRAGPRCRKKREAFSPVRVVDASLMADLSVRSSSSARRGRGDRVTQP